MWVMVFKHFVFTALGSLRCSWLYFLGLRLVALGASNICRFEDFLQAAPRVSHGLIGL